MKVSVFGAGYVGLVTGACLAELGYEVVCADVDSHKIAQLQQGISPIYEPGLSEMVQRQLQTKRIHFTTDIALAVHHGLFQFIAVGTPSDQTGAADLSYVLAVASSIGQHLQNEAIIINKSTVPIGTARRVQQVIATQLQQRHQQVQFDVVSNPEFLKEGHAITDFMKPDRIVVGADNAATIEKMRTLYAPLIDTEQRFIAMDLASAELSKYASNAFLATKISFMNEISRLADSVQADIEQVRLAMGTDQRIGPQFLFAGCGYGGSCFPKDVRALQKMMEQQGLTAQILGAVEAVNTQQKYILLDKIRHFFAGQLKNKVIALWGLAFKPNTNDMREASSRVLMEGLWQEGAKIQAYDPVAMPDTHALYGARADLQLCDSAQAALTGADVLVIVTEWQEFRQPDFQVIEKQLRYPVIFDGRNLYDPVALSQLGLTYYGIGRGQSMQGSVLADAIKE